MLLTSKNRLATGIFSSDRHFRTFGRVKLLAASEIFANLRLEIFLVLQMSFLPSFSQNCTNVWFNVKTKPQEILCEDPAENRLCSVRGTESICIVLQFLFTDLTDFQYFRRVCYHHSRKIELFYLCWFNVKAKPQEINCEDPAENRLCSVLGTESIRIVLQLPFTDLQLRGKEPDSETNLTLNATIQLAGLTFQKQEVAFIHLRQQNTFRQTIRNTVCVLLCLIPFMVEDFAGWSVSSIVFKT